MIEELSEPRRIEGGRLGALYIEHAADARRLAYLLTSDAANADDIVQDAFVRMAGRLLDFRSPEASRAYIRKVVVSLAASRFRKRRAEAARDERHRGEQALVHSDPDPTERDRLWRVMQRLPERQRAALVLRYYIDLPDAAIADVLRCRPGTVKSLLSRGLSAMREVISDE